MNIATTGYYECVLSSAQSVSYKKPMKLKLLNNKKIYKKKKKEKCDSQPRFLSFLMRPLSALFNCAKVPH